MQLTAEQIECINQTLIAKGLKYEDIKLEVLDHIATEIEVLMNLEKASFERSLNITLKNWQEHLKPSTSMWIWGINPIPQMVIKKCNKMMFNVFVMSLSLGLVFAIIVTLFIKSTANSEILEILNTVLKGFGITGIILLFFVKYKLWKSKQYSSFRYLFDRNGFLQIINLSAIATGLFQFKGNEFLTNFNFMPAFLPITIIMISGFYAMLAIKHFQFEKKLKNS
jgi:hypothetical protein